MKKFALILVAVILVTGGAFGQSTPKTTKATTLMVEGDYLHTTSATTAWCDNGTSREVSESTIPLTIQQEGSKVALPPGREAFGTLTSYSSTCWLSDDVKLFCHRVSSTLSKEFGAVDVTTIAFAQHNPEGYEGTSHGMSYQERTGVTCAFELNFAGKRK